MPEPVSPLPHGQLRTLTRNAWRFKRELDWKLYFQQFQAHRKLPVFGIGCTAYMLLDESLTQDERIWMRDHNPYRVSPITCWVLPYKEEDMEALLGQPVSFLPGEMTLVEVPAWLKLVELRQFPFPQTNGIPGKVIPLNIPRLSLPRLPKPGHAQE